METVIIEAVKSSPALILLFYFLFTTNKKLDALFNLEMYKLGKHGDGEMEKALDFIKNGRKH